MNNRFVYPINVDLSFNFSLVWYTFLDSTFQKHGIASELLSLWEKDAFGEGAHILQLWTTKNDIPFYLNRGFKKGGSFPQSWFGVDHFLFYKILRKPNEKVFLKKYLAKKSKGKKESSLLPK